MIRLYFVIMSDLLRLGYFFSVFIFEIKLKMFIFYFNFGLGNLDFDFYDKV